MENNSQNLGKERALIYCRVSSDRQVKEGHGLDSQEKRCRDFAQNNDLLVEKVFREEGITGGLFDRPAMKNLLDYLDKHVGKKYVIIFDDIKRFARETTIHFQIKSEIYGRGSRVASPNFRFEDTPEGKFVETVFAAQAELERNQNKRQVIQKMKARLDLGYWPFCPPPGLKNMQDPARGKVLQPQPPLSDIYKEAIEKFESRELLTQEEVQAFILKRYREYGIKRPLSLNGTRNILTEILYTGYVEYQPWSVALKKGQHSGFISLETHNHVLDILNERSRPHLRKDYDADFPLRPYMLCKHCGVPMTASWHKGRSKRYPHYWCKNKNCPYWSKTINRDKIENEFVKLLIELKPTTEMVELAKTIFIELWESSKHDFIAQKQRVKDELRGIDEKKQSLLDKLIKTNNEAVIRAYEEEIARLDELKRKLTSESKIEMFSEDDLGTAFDTVMTVMKDPAAIWKTGSQEWKRNLIFMYFEGGLAYDYQNGFGTSILALPVKLINELWTSQSKHVEMPGIEPGCGETRLQKFSEG